MQDITRELSELPRRPVKPDEAECCGRNCENCVFVYYAKAMTRWRQRLAEQGLTDTEIDTLSL